MHNTVYASGFLYHLPSEQILLHQSPSSSDQPSHWSLFGQSHTEEETAVDIFKRVISDILGIRIKDVQTVYSYFHDKTNLQHTIVYSELKVLKNFSPKNGVICQWFSFKDVVKLPIPEQTKHDIVVSKRVIDASARQSRGEFTSTS